MNAISCAHTEIHLAHVLRKTCARVKIDFGVYARNIMCAQKRFFTLVNDAHASLPNQT